MLSVRCGFNRPLVKACRFFLIVMTIACLLLTVVSDASFAARKKSKQRPAVDRSASIVIEADTGHILSESNADKQLYPASLTKMMTLYMAFEALDRGALRKETRIPVSSHAARQEPSSLGLKAGTSIRVEDAILGLVTKSANDAAAALGEALGGGSEARFAKIMTARAKQLGMTRTQFANASGLFHPSQISTARDMARLGQALIHDYPRYYRYFSTTRFVWAGRSFQNHNHLMRNYSGMDGIKTGYVRQSGFNLVASAVHGDTRLIGVVFGGSTANNRNAQMAKLLNNGFAKVETPQIASLIRQKKQRLASTQNNTSQNKGAVLSATMSAPTALDRAQDQTFNSIGLMVQNNAAIADDRDEGEGDAEEAAVPPPVPEKPSFAARSMNTEPINTADINPGSWAIQVGTFSSHDSSVRAITNAQKRLPSSLASKVTPVIVPLSTNRGIIYRARLFGFNKDTATKACGVLKDHCLILSGN